MSVDHRGPDQGPDGALALAAAGLLGAATLASIAGPSAVAGAATPSVVLTVPTALHHAYRHGAVPRKTRDVAGVQALGFSPTAPGAELAIAKASKAKLVRYGGGLTTGGLTAAGVTTGQPQGLPGVHGEPVGNRDDRRLGSPRLQW